MTLITSQMALGDCEDPVKYWQHIDAFLCCAGELALPQNKPGHHLVLRDAAPIDLQHLDAAFRFLDEQLQAKRLVLVYCGHGLSRSVSVLTGYLALKSSEDPDVVLQRIKKLRSAVCPSGRTYESMIRYVKQKRAGV